MKKIDNILVSKLRLESDLKTREGLSTPRNFVIV